MLYLQNTINMINRMRSEPIVINAIWQTIIIPPETISTAIINSFLNNIPILNLYFAKIYLILTSRISRGKFYTNLYFPLRTFPTRGLLYRVYAEREIPQGCYT